MQTVIQKYTEARIHAGWVGGHGLQRKIDIMVPTRWGAIATSMESNVDEILEEIERQRCNVVGYADDHMNFVRGPS